MSRDEYTDMALLKRYSALKYAQRKAALREAIRLELPYEVIREVRRQVRELITTWRMLREAMK